MLSPVHEIALYKIQTTARDASWQEPKAHFTAAALIFYTIQEAF